MNRAPLTPPGPGNEAPSGPGPIYFATTHWSVVLEAGQRGSLKSVEALEELCRNYWRPLYAFVRRQGYTPEDAQDSTQAFFERFLRREYISLADPSRGKFRTFLLRSMENFLINEWTKELALKRGGGTRIVSLQEQEAEDRYLSERSDNSTPAQIFDKRWALTLLQQVLGRLREEFSKPDKQALFDSLKGCVLGEESDVSYHEIGLEFGMTEGAVKIAVLRMRQRYRELLRAEVANTVETPAQVDEELKHLAAVLRGQT